MLSLLSGSFAPRRWSIVSPSRLRIVDWNIDRGLQLDRVIQFLQDHPADVLMLQEVDINAKRTGFRNIAEEIARKLGMNYVFGCEFQELSQGRPDSPAYHGQATLSVWPLEHARIIRFARQSSFWNPRWFIPHWQIFQERLGGRIALVVEAKLGGRSLALYNLHLESRGDDELRRAQLAQALRDAARYMKTPIVLGGDLNLHAGQPCVARQTRQASFLNAFSGENVATTPPRSIFENGRTIDWLFTRGSIETSHAAVHRDVHASDHYPLCLTARLR